MLAEVTVRLLTAAGPAHREEEVHLTVEVREEPFTSCKFKTTEADLRPEIYTTPCRFMRRVCELMFYLLLQMCRQTATRGRPHPSLYCIQSVMWCIRQLLRERYLGGRRAVNLNFLTGCCWMSGLASCCESVLIFVAMIDATVPYPCFICAHQRELIVVELRAVG